MIGLCLLNTNLTPEDCSKIIEKQIAIRNNLMSTGADYVRQLEAKGDHVGADQMVSTIIMCMSII